MTTPNKPYELTMPVPDKNEKPDYNSTREALKLPEYGRMVQDMVEYALTISNKEERQRYAEAIVRVMIGLNPKMSDVPDFRHKIWDHLAYLSGYKLDIDYPFEITRHEGRHMPPPRLSYPKNSIRFRHYGHLIEEAIQEIPQQPAGAQREEYVRLLANRMKRNLADWKGDGVQDTKVARDIAFYTDGEVVPDFSQPGKQLMQIGENRFRTRKNRSQM